MLICVPHAFFGSCANMRSEQTSQVSAANVFTSERSEQLDKQGFSWTRVIFKILSPDSLKSSGAAALKNLNTILSRGASKLHK